MATQVVLESAETAVEYQSVRVGADVIRRDMAFDRSRDNVYVMTSSQVRSSSITLPPFIDPLGRSKTDIAAQLCGASNFPPETGNTASRLK